MHAFDIVAHGRSTVRAYRRSTVRAYGHSARYGRTHLQVRAFYFFAMGVHTGVVRFRFYRIYCIIHCMTQCVNNAYKFANYTA